MNNLHRKLSLSDGIALGIGSIMGSGILFLPALTYQIAGSGVLLSWAITMLLCLPILLLFSDMVKVVPSEQGIGGLLTLGLGRHVSAGLPILLIGTVSIGMPSAALIASSYVCRYLKWDDGYQMPIAAILIVGALCVNFLGLKIAAVAQKLIAGGLFLIGSFVLFFGHADVSTQQIKTLFSGIDHGGSILAASVVSFWAFAGFENMTFMAGEFKRPEKDLPRSIAISLIICGLLYMGLTLKTLEFIEKKDIDPSLGLYQLAEKSAPGSKIIDFIVLFAIVAVMINLISWTWGISRMIYANAMEEKLPTFLGKLDHKGMPRRSLIFFGLLLLLGLSILSVTPDFFDIGLTLVSTNFVFIYFLCGLAYINFSMSKAKKILGITLSVALLCSLFSSGWLVLYPLVLVSLGVVFSFLRTKKGQFT